MYPLSSMGLWDLYYVMYLLNSHLCRSYFHRRENVKVFFISHICNNSLIRDENKQQQHQLYEFVMKYHSRLLGMQKKEARGF